MIRPWFWLGWLLVLLEACSAGASAGPEAAAPARALFSSASLYQRLGARLSGATDASEASLRSLRLDEFYQVVLSHTPDQSVVLDGQDYGNALAEVRGAAAFYKALGAIFPTMGTLWDAAGVGKVPLSEGEFTRTLTAGLGKAAAGLGLTAACADGAQECVETVNAYNDSQDCQLFWNELQGKGVMQDTLLTSLSTLESRSGGSGKGDRTQIVKSSTVIRPDLPPNTDYFYVKRVPENPSMAAGGEDDWAIVGLESGANAVWLNELLNKCTSGQFKKRHG